jgi:hypothetical protein
VPEPLPAQLAALLVPGAIESGQVQVRVEPQRGFAGVRADMRRLHETDDDLRRRIEIQEQRGA